MECNNNSELRRACSATAAPAQDILSVFSRIGGSDSSEWEEIRNK